MNAFTPTTVMSPASMRRTRSALLCTSRCFMRVDHGERPAAVEHPLQLGLGRLGELGGLGLDDVRPGEEVVVLEQVGLEREHLLDAQRPLLVPRSREPERLVPRGELHGAGRARPSTA